MGPGRDGFILVQAGIRSVLGSVAQWFPSQCVSELPGDFHTKTQPRALVTLAASASDICNDV